MGRKRHNLISATSVIVLLLLLNCMYYGGQHSQDNHNQNAHSQDSYSKWFPSFAAVPSVFGQQPVYPLTQPSNQTDGPGLSKIPFQDQELFTVISRINADNGAPKSHGAVSMHNGYLVIIYAIGGGRYQGGFAFYDISDPYTPQFVNGRDDEETFEIREAHGYGYSSTYTGEFEGTDLVALQARRGVQIWDWTDVQNPLRISYLHLDGVGGGDYTNANWWTFWQAPIIYVAGADSGIYIIDATDPRNPVLADRDGQPNPIPNSLTGGFRIGSLYAVGNLLVVAGNDVPGYATLDISDPINPILLSSTTSGPENYSVLLNGNRIYGAARFKELYTHDISDPENIRQVGYFKGTNDKGGYLSYQDGFIHIGASVNYMKIDVQDDNNYFSVGKATTGIADGDQDFVTVLGNMIVLGDDHDYGSFLIPHQSEPDNVGPTVTMVSPKDGVLNQRTTTRIGLTFSDLIDLRSVNSETIQIRPVSSNSDSEENLAGYFSGQTGIVNFTPNQPLEPNTVYEIYVPANGVTDVSGNRTPSDFRSYFSTGSNLSVPPTCAIVPVPPILLGTTTTLTATRLSGIGAVTYSWDFGDGTPPTAPSSSWTTAHTYASVGHYTIRTTITNVDNSNEENPSSQESSTCVTQATVYPTLADEKAVRSTTILVDERGQKIWNVNPDNDTVTAISSDEYRKLFEQPVGQNPRTLALAPDNTIWVVNAQDATISILDSTDGSLIRTIDLPYGSQPYGILFHMPTENVGEAVAYVSLQATGKVVRIGLLSRSINSELSVGSSPRALALSGDGSHLFVARYISPIDQGEITEIETSTFMIQRTLTLPIDPGPDTESSGRGVPNGLGQVAISPDGRRLWVPAKKDNTLRGLLTDGQNHGFDSTVRTIVAQVNLESNVEDPTERHDIENSDQASAVDFSALGDYAFVTIQGSNAVAVIDTESRLMTTRLHNVGRAPIGLALYSDGSRLFVHSFLSRSVLVYDVPALLAGDVTARSPLAEVGTVLEEKLTPIVLEGKRIFYNAEDPRMNKDGYLSCATCHLDGDQDGRVWDRNGQGEGMRNTTSLLGRGGMAQGRVHWSGNFDEIQDFEQDMRVVFGGLGFLTDDQYEVENRNHPLGGNKAGLNNELDALAAYVASLIQIPHSPYRNPDGSLTADGIAGRTLFEAHSCASCHAGPYFTDSPSGLLHDVGTIRSDSGQRLNGPLLGIDTPTLHGLWQSEPYLHNGSAPTLESVLTGNEHNAPHGDAANLSSAERTLLISYLLQLDGNEAAPPTAFPPLQLAIPSDGERFAPGETILLQADLLQAEAWQAGSSITSRNVNQVTFYVNGVAVGNVEQPPYAIQWHAPTDGNGSLYLLAVKAHFADGQGVAHEAHIVLDATVPTKTPQPTATPIPATPMPTLTATVTPTPTNTQPDVSPTVSPTATATVLPAPSGPDGLDGETIYLPLMSEGNEE
ncbi:MAG: Ig-like domain-containing protein [Chloroflexota bacterium]